MNPRRPGIVSLGFYLLITTIGFLVWVAVLFALWNLLQQFNFTSDLMVTIEALSTAVTAAALLAAGFLAYRELSEVATSRHMDIADRLFDELNSSENIEARRRVFQNLPEKPEEGIKHLSADDRKAAKAVLDSLDRVAFLTQAGWIPDEVIMPWIHPMVAKTWSKLGPYVLHERTRRSEPYYYQYVGELAERSQKWRAKHHSEAEVEWVENALCESILKSPERLSWVRGLACEAR